MESLSKEKNLIVGLLLGMAIAIAIPYAQPSELGASEEVTAVTEDRFDEQAMDCNGFVHLDNEWLKRGQIEMVCK